MEYNVYLILALSSFAVAFNRLVTGVLMAHSSWFLPDSIRQYPPAEAIWQILASAAFAAIGVLMYRIS